MPPPRILLSIVASIAGFFALSSRASADLVHTISSATDVAVTANGYTAGGSLDLTLGFAPTPGTNLTIVRNTASAFISGTFTNASQGSTVPLTYNGITYHYIANYYGGNGRSLVLHWPLTRLAAWGANSYGQLGIGDTYRIATPMTPRAPAELAGTTIIAIAAGESHSLALCADGKLYGWGSNYYGELGNIGGITSTVPVALDTGAALTGKTIIAIDAGVNTSYVLTSDGKVFAWGFNSYGQLGNGSSSGSNTPVAVNDTGVLAGKVVTSVSAGPFHVMVLTSDGQVFAWGLNDRGQLANNSTTNSPVPVAIDSSGVLAGRTVVGISAGYQHGLACASDGMAFSWGANLSGQLGNNSTTSSLVPVMVAGSGALAGKSVVAVSAGFSSSMAMASNGEVFAWGANGSYQLGNNSTATSLVPLQCGGSLAGKFAIRHALGNGHGLALTSDGQPHAWGSNNDGQIGNNGSTDTPQPVPVALGTLGPLAGKSVADLTAGASHSLAIVDAGPPVVRTSPYHRSANTGASVSFTATPEHPFPVSVQWQVSPTGPSGPFSDITGNPSALTPVLTLTGVSQAQDGSAYRAVFSNDSGSIITEAATLTIINWAADFQSGDNVLNEVDGAAVSGPLNLQLSFQPTPGTHLTIIRNNGPALIDGSFTNIPDGGTVPLTFNGVTYNYIANYRGGNGRSLVLQWPCMGLAGWGSNQSGILGNIGTSDQPIPLNLPLAGPLAGKAIASISASNGHILVLTTDGKVFSWGLNSYGQLGNNSTANTTVPVAVSESGPLANLTVVAVAAGFSRSLAITSDGRVFAWGKSRPGFQSSGSTLVPTEMTPAGSLAGKTVVAVSIGTNHELALTSDGEVHAWGDNNYGQLGDSSRTSHVEPRLVERAAMGDKAVIAIAAGDSHSLALTIDGKIHSWGSGTEGELGNANATVFSAPLPVAVDTSGALSGKTMVAIAATNDRSMALSSDGKVFAWGRNWSGELGNNTTLPSYLPSAVTSTGALAGKSVSMISAGSSHSMALTSDGWVYAWGDNGYGQLGDTTWTDRTEPVAATPSGALAGRKATAIAAVGWQASLAMIGLGSPTITRHPLDHLAASGDPATFSAEATDPFVITIQWQESPTGPAGPFQDLTGNATANTGQLVLSGITPEMNGRAYRAVFRNDAGITITSAATLTVTAWTAVFNSANDIPYASPEVTVSGVIPVQLGYAPATGEGLTLVKNTGPAFIQGTFDNIPQGGVVTLSFNGVNYDFVANYFGGNGRSLVLQWPWTKLAAWGSNSLGQFANGNTTSSTTPVAADARAVLAERVLSSASAGANHNLALTSNGKVFAWGTNGSGQLGVGNTTTSLVAAPVVDSGVLLDKTVIAVAAGGLHSLALTPEGTVYSWGSNFSKQLGNNSSTNSSVPVAVDSSGVLGGRTIAAIAAGDDHSLALASDGRVFSWGDNSYYQLGNNGWQDSPIPVAVESGGALLGKTVVSIAAGERHSVALTSDGEVVTWGTNTYGQLGDNSTTESRVPVKVHAAGALAGKMVVAIAAGASHTMALTSDGRVFTWGYNSSGQLGDGGTSNSPVPVEVDSTGVLAGKFVTAIAAGASHCMALTSDGQLVTWGNNGSGRLGNGNTTSSSVPVAVNAAGVLSGRKVPALFAGTNHSMVMYGAPGGPTVVTQPLDRSLILGSSPAGVQVGFSAAALDIFPFTIQWQVSPSGINGPFTDISGNPSAMTSNLGLTGVGFPNHGYAYRALFSNNGGTGASNPAVLSVLSAASPVVFPAAAYIPFTAANPIVAGALDINLGFAPTPGTTLTLIRNTGLGFITGQFSNLTHGATLPLTFGGVTHDFVVNYYGGNGRSLVLQWAATRMTAWGAGSSGQLGNNSITTNRIPVAVDATGVLSGKSLSAIAAGSSHSLALTTSGRVLSWGANPSGQLGNNATTNSTVPVEVAITGVLAGKLVVAVAGGSAHSLALTSDGQVFAWGSNGSGRLGISGISNSPIPVAVSGVLNSKTVTAIAAGGTHSMALTTEGKVYAWGANSFGQLGNNSTALSPVPVEVDASGVLLGKTVIAIAAGLNHSMALTSDGRVFTWGSNQYGQLGKSSPSTSLVPVAAGNNGLVGISGTTLAITAGSNHSMALDSNGKVSAWGLGSSGQLGNGIPSSGSNPVAVSTSGVLSGKSVSLITAGGNHSLAVTSDGLACAWGSNDSGQLGNNSVSPAYSPVLITTSSGAVGTRMVSAIACGSSHSMAICGAGTAPSVTANPQDRTVASSASVSFSAAADGYPAPTVRWQASPTGPAGTFTNITGNASATTLTLHLTGVSASQNGYAYRAVFTNSETSTNSAAAVLTVIPPPTLNLPANLIANAVDKNGAAVSFNVTATDNLDGPLMPSCTPSSGTVFPIGATTVTCSATNSLGSTSTASFTVTVLRTFDSFRDLHGITDPDPLADPNHTGINNLMAYAFDITPSAPDRSRLPTVSIASGYLQISYQRWKSTADLSYLVEVTDDMINWNSGNGHTQQVSVTSLSATRELVVVRDSVPVADAPHRYIRIRIEK